MDWILSECCDAVFKDIESWEDALFDTRACKEVACPTALKSLCFTVPMFTAGKAAPSLELLHLAHTILKMADEEVATKAPESDAQQPSMVSAEDTPAQTGASMGV